MSDTENDISDIKELSKAMLRFSWAMPIFGADQLVKIFQSQVLDQKDAKPTEAFNSMADSTEAQLSGAFKPAFRAGDQLQAAFLEALSGLLTAEALNPVYASKVISDALKESTEAVQEVAGAVGSVGWQPKAAKLNLGYSNASFQGNYGFSIRYGPRTAVGVGVAISDGKGNFHGIQKLNTQGQHIRFTFEGTYDVAENGTGTADVDLKAPDGTITKASFDYNVLQSLDVGTFKFGTEWQGITREPTDGTYGVSWFKTIP